MPDPPKKFYTWKYKLKNVQPNILYWYIHVRENTEQIFVGIRNFYKETDEQEIIFAMDLSEHSGFTPFTRELTLFNSPGIFGFIGTREGARFAPTH